MKATLVWSSVAAVVLSLGMTPQLAAHCDTLNGPVVADGRIALAKGDPGIVLKWVETGQEAEIRAAFAKTLAVRKLSAGAAELADRWFFETLVRVHRASEGMPYTGLKDGTELEPGVEAADHALASGDAEHLLHEAGERVQTELTARFERAREALAHRDHNTGAGRAYVAAYVDYMHFAERLFAITAAPSAGTEGPSPHDVGAHAQ